MGTRQRRVLVAVLRPFASYGRMKQLQLTIHPFSALIGAALVCLTMLTVGAIAVQGSSSTRDVSAIEDVNDVHPRDCIIIKNGTPYVVPAGRILVVTAFGDSDSVSTGYIHLTVDGVEEIGCKTKDYGEGVGMITGIVPTPKPGLILNQGQTLSFSSSDTNFRAWGYLVDA